MEETRKVILLNRKWKFMHGDAPAAMQIDFCDEAWYDVGIPHSFGIPYYMTNEFYVGYGCYRKWFSVTKEDLAKRVSLEFQAVFQVAEVYVNGQYAGKHAGGYTPFCLDVTHLLHEGENLLALRVNNEWNARIAPRAGEHVFQGGIYRDVSLIVTDPVHVAWYGTRITTPEITAEAAQVHVETELVNETGETVNITVENRILEGDKVIAVQQAEVELPAGVQKTTAVLTLPQPKLWHPDHPDLYNVQTLVSCGAEVRDEVNTEFGVRYFRFDAKEGFFLNGEHYNIHGANVHQDHMGWSDAVTHAGIARDIAMVKECGLNFIRGSHYPHHTVFARECDHQGILFWSELCYWGVGSAQQEGYWSSSAYPIHEEDQADFEASCIQTLKEMIRANRNHPSIVVWSMCNEVFFTDPSVLEKTRALLEKLVEVAHEEDPSRPAGVGGVQRGNLDHIGDLAGYNGDGASLFIDPGVPNLLSEYGCFMTQRPGPFTPNYRYNETENLPWRSGKVLWCAFHHGSICNDMGEMGMIDYSRLPMGTWYWYRKHLKGIEPDPASVDAPAAALKMSVDRYDIATDGTEDCHLIVRLLDDQGRRVSAAPEVLLEVLSGDGRFPEGRTMRLRPDNNTFLDGMGAVEMRAYFAGDIRVRATCGELQDEIVIHAHGDEKWDGRELRMIQPPPYLLGVPSNKDGYNLAQYHPVYCSENVDHAKACAIVDIQSHSCWSPEKLPCSATVDLEGNRYFDMLVIRLRGSSEGLKISLSKDLKKFVPVKMAKVDDTTLSAPIHANWRYIRLEVEHNAPDIYSVQCLLKGEQS